MLWFSWLCPLETGDFNVRKLLGVLAASFLAVGVAGQAHAAALGFVGVLGIQVATLAPVMVSAPVPRS